MKTTLEIPDPFSAGKATAGSRKTLKQFVTESTE